jgi:cobalamin 5'-phosphate synthase/cobalamin synthase
MSEAGGQALSARRWPELRALVAAVTFLTRIPLGRWIVLDGEDVARAGPAFPLVGAGIGAAVGGTATVLAHPLSPLLAIALALTLGALLTGALHLDALADSADALGAASRERALAIMRDHTVGAYGVVAVALDLLIRAGALSALLHHDHLLRFAIAAGALSRLTPVLLATALPYARDGSGAGDSLTQGGPVRAVVAGVVAVAIAVILVGVSGAALTACAIATAAVLALAFRRWLGGVTGDALGAGVELTELVVLIVAVALTGAGG